MIGTLVMLHYEIDGVDSLPRKLLLELILSWWKTSIIIKRNRIK